VPPLHKVVPPGSTTDALGGVLFGGTNDVQRNIITAHSGVNL
jgi:hypothetical protein